MAKTRIDYSGLSTAYGALAEKAEKINAIRKTANSISESLSGIQDAHQGFGQTTEAIEEIKNKLNHYYAKVDTLKNYCAEIASVFTEAEDGMKVDPKSLKEFNNSVVGAEINLLLTGEYAPLSLEYKDGKWKTEITGASKANSNWNNTRLSNIDTDGKDWSKLSKKQIEEYTQASVVKHASSALNLESEEEQQTETTTSYGKRSSGGGGGVAYTASAVTAGATAGATALANEVAETAKTTDEKEENKDETKDENKELTTLENKENKDDTKADTSREKATDTENVTDDTKEDTTKTDTSAENKINETIEKGKEEIKEAVDSGKEEIKEAAANVEAKASDKMAEVRQTVAEKSGGRSSAPATSTPIEDVKAEPKVEEPTTDLPPEDEVTPPTETPNEPDIDIPEPSHSSEPTDGATITKTPSGTSDTPTPDDSAPSSSGNKVVPVVAGVAAAGAAGVGTKIYLDRKSAPTTNVVNEEYVYDDSDYSTTEYETADSGTTEPNLLKEESSSYKTRSNSETTDRDEEYEDGIEDDLSYDDNMRDNDLSFDETTPYEAIDNYEMGETH